MTLRSSLATLSVVGVALLLLLLLPIPIPLRAPSLATALWESIENLGHPAAFAVFAMFLQRFLRTGTHLGGRAVTKITLTVCIVLGGATEFLQSVTGRDSSWSDLLGDTLGTLAAMWAAAAVRNHKAGLPPRRVWTPAAAAVVTAMLAVAPFGFTVAAYVERASMAPVFWRSDSRLLQRFAISVGGKYPGLMVEEPPRDWSSYRFLVIDVTNTDSTTRNLQLRVHDRMHDNSYADRFNTTLQLPPGPSRHVVDLGEVRTAPRSRLMQMQYIREVALFVRHPETMDALHVDRLALRR